MRLPTLRTPPPSLSECLLLLQDPRVRILRREAMWVGAAAGVVLGSLAVLLAVSLLGGVRP